MTRSIIPGGNGGRMFPSTLMAWWRWMNAANRATYWLAWGLSTVSLRTGATVVAFGASKPSSNAFPLLSARTRLTWSWARWRLVVVDERS